MNIDFKNYEDFTNKEKVKKYIDKGYIYGIPNLNKEQIGLIMSVFNNYGDCKKEFLLLKIGELIIKLHKVGGYKKRK